MGFSEAEAMRQPTGLLRLMAAMTQVKEEGARFTDQRVFDPETMDIDDFLPGL
jgi:hypothetical protein